MKVEKLPREEVINNFIEGFLHDFHYLLTKKNLDVPELPDDVIIRAFDILIKNIIDISVCLCKGLLVEILIDDIGNDIIR